MTCVRYTTLLLFELACLWCLTDGFSLFVEENRSAATFPNHLPDEEHKYSLYTSETPVLERDDRTTIPATFSPPPQPPQPDRVVTSPASVATSVAPAATSAEPTLSSQPQFTLKPGLTTQNFTNTSPTTESNTTSSSSPALSTSEKGAECNCSVEGGVCDALTGRCVCLVGYRGAHCEECEDGFFTNGTGGCLTCGCDLYGAVGTRCDSSGVCVCKTGVYGDKCDDCRPGFFHFSSTGCQPCQCNNHSSVCDTQSGECVQCRGNTRGFSCQLCKLNFYRDLGSSVSAGCLPCPCSSVTSTASCTLDSTGQPVCDECRPGYEGPHCEQCRHGYYNADSICALCNCSRSAPVCQPDTGRCLNCSSNTAGAHCERCAPGFTGDALAGNCTPEVLPTLPPTMSIAPNATTATLLSILTSAPTSVAATPPAEVSWAQFNVAVLAVIVVALAVLTGAVGGAYAYREYRNRKLNAPFWTIELKEDNISFSSYHDNLPTADISGLLDDEQGDAVATNGQLTVASGNTYRA